MKKALCNLTSEQITFICAECNITNGELLTMSEDDLYDKVYDVMCDIELEEIPDDGKEESDRCKIASSIVTELGNALAIEQGIYDESEE